MSPSPAPSPSFLASLPGWAGELVRAVWAKQANVFILHGMASDLVPVGVGGEQASSKAASDGSSPLPAPPGNASATLAASGGSSRFLPLEDFLQQELFVAWPSILTYNRAEGIGFGSAAARGHFQDRLRAY